MPARADSSGSLRPGEETRHDHLARRDSPSTTGASTWARSRRRSSRSPRSRSGGAPTRGATRIGNLLAHLDGNLSQWVLAGLGGEPFERHRDAEFAARGGAVEGRAARAACARRSTRCCAVAVRAHGRRPRPPSPHPEVRARRLPRPLPHRRAHELPHRADRPARQAPRRPPRLLPAAPRRVVAPRSVRQRPRSRFRRTSYQWSSSSCSTATRRAPRCSCETSHTASRSTPM